MTDRDRFDELADTIYDLPAMHDSGEDRCRAAIAATLRAHFRPEGSVPVIVSFEWQDGDPANPYIGRIHDGFDTITAYAIPPEPQDVVGEVEG